MVPDPALRAFPAFGAKRAYPPTRRLFPVFLLSYRLVFPSFKTAVALSFFLNRSFTHLTARILSHFVRVPCFSQADSSFWVSKPPSPLLE